MKRSICVVVSVLMNVVVLAQSDAGIDVRFQVGVAEGLPVAVAKVLGLPLPTENGFFRYQITDPAREEAIRRFFEVMPYTTVVGARAEREVRPLSDIQPVFVRVEGGLEPSLFAEVYRTSFSPVQRPLGNGVWYLAFTPDSMTSDAFRTALGASPFILEIEQTRQPERGPGEGNRTF
ncbi:MAG: hypothetical protein U5L04_06205 [Trueperaceae bacterium]|nr:hypothetical protein [Trueperaceae bacterium]